MKVFLLQAVVILAVSSCAFAIYCFECNSMKDTRCDVSFKPYPKAIVDCDDQPLVVNNVSFNATFCRKITQIVYGITRVTRSCGYVPHAKENKRNRCSKSSFVEATESFYCDCNEDFCNGFSGSTRLSLSFAIFIGLAFVLIIAQ